MQEGIRVRTLVHAAGDHVCKVVQCSHSKRLEIGLELSRRPDLGWNIAMTISQSLRRLGWSVPRMLDWNVVLGPGAGGGGVANRLKCSIRVHKDLRRVALQHFFSELAPGFGRGASEFTEGFEGLQGHD